MNSVRCENKNRLFFVFQFFLDTYMNKIMSLRA